jgi:beta-glucanase (GH16 family)
MNPLLLIFTILLSTTTEQFAVAQTVSATRRNNENVTFAPGDLIWSDEFDHFDHNKWRNEININGGYNNEFQIYDDYGENAYTRDGILYIRPTQSLDTVFNGNFEQLYNGYLSLDGCTDAPGDTCSRQASYPWINQPVVSQRLRTKGTFSFTYGRVEARIKMPSGDWTWPAFWMLPEADKYGGWPRSGEVDISEVRGNRKLFDWQGVNIGSEQQAATLHFGPRDGLNGFMLTHGTRNTPVDQGLDRDFHIYEVIWTPEMIQFKLDGAEFKTIQPGAGGFFELGQFPDNVENIWRNGRNPRMAPFDENFHLMLNVAIGGDYFPDNTTPQKPWQGSQQTFLDFFNNREQWGPSWSGENSGMALDYIRVYAV